MDFVPYKVINQLTNLNDTRCGTKYVIGATERHEATWSTFVRVKLVVDAEQFGPRLFDTTCELESLLFHHGRI